MKLEEALKLRNDDEIINEKTGEIITVLSIEVLGDNVEIDALSNKEGYIKIDELSIMGDYIRLNYGDIA